MWAEFREEYENKILPGMSASTRELATQALNQFERLAKPKRMRSIDGRTISEFVAKRRQDRGRQPGSVVAPATINKELRHLRAVLRKAAKWDYLPKPIEFEFEREPGKLPTYISPEHFAKLYAACDGARWPARMPFAAGDWWRALLIFGYMTGWRIGSMLALRWEDVDLDSSKVVSRYEDNKGRRDQAVPVHELIVQHLQRLKSFQPRVFPWFHGRRQLYDEFANLQRAAGVRPEGRKEVFGFHDLRRSFATMNADRLTPDALQVLMQHRDYQTTQRYIAIARQLNPAVASLFVPPVPALTNKRVNQ
jgi:integrase